MKLKKADRRFTLYDHGFTHFLEFDHSDWQNYNMYSRQCAKQFGTEFLMTCGHIWQNGNWKTVYRHRTRRGKESKRIYFRGEKYHTMLMLALSSTDKNTVYL